VATTWSVVGGELLLCRLAGYIGIGLSDGIAIEDEIDLVESV
jgi:hypothetical protein